MDRTTYYQQCRHLLQQVHFVVMATTNAAGHPWATPVFAWHDERLRFYWVSDRQNQHSRNVRASRRAFVVLYDSVYDLALPHDGRQGLYLQCTVDELCDPAEIRAAPVSGILLMLYL